MKSMTAGGAWHRRKRASKKKWASRIPARCPKIKIVGFGDSKDINEKSGKDLLVLV
jgi:hypothetical protein